MRGTRATGMGLMMAGVLFGGCADPHFNLDVRNMTGEVVDLRLVAENRKESEPERVVSTARVAPGSSTSIFTKAKQGDKPRLEARVEGDEQGEPAVLRLRSGLHSIDVFPAAGGAGATPRLRLREVRREQQ